MNYVRGTILWGVLVALCTELLSATHLLTRPGIVTAWTIVLVTWLVTRYRRSSLRSAEPREHPLPMAAAFYLAVTLVILLITFGLALIAAPTAGDAFSYHLPRVAQWVQNGSVAFYPTNIDRQLWANPWSEYVVLHLQLLTGSDRLANLVQWAAFAGSTAVAILIARLLGCSRENQLVAGLFTATIPMAIAQSTGAQTDLVASFWLLVFVAATLEGHRSAADVISANRVMLLGASLGLAILTKGTNYLFAFPFLLWWGVRHWHRRRIKLWKDFALLALVVAAVNGPHYYRNWNLYGWPLGPRGNEGVINATFQPAAVVSNLVRNAALHVGTPNDTRLPLSIKFNAAAHNIVEKIHDRLGIDINDPRTTWRTYRFKVPFESRHENMVGNPFHTLLILLSLVLIFLAPRASNGFARGYAICLVFQVFLFCLALRWQPFNSRLQLPVFVAAAPLVAWAAGQFSRRWATLLIAAVLAYRAVPAILKNPARPLTGDTTVQSMTREQRYFIDQPQIQAPYTGAAEFLARSGCREIALQTGWAEWEYAFWAVARPRLRTFHIRHIGVANPSRSLAAKESSRGQRPCAVVSLKEDEPGTEAMAWPSFTTVWRLNGVTVQFASSPMDSGAAGQPRTGATTDRR